MATKTKTKKPAKATRAAHKEAPARKRKQPAAPAVEHAPQLDNHLTWHTEAKAERWSTAQAHTWETACGRYRVHRVDSDSKDRIYFATQFKTDNGRWDSCEADAKQGPGYAKHYKHLEDALTAAVSHFAGKLAAGGKEVTVTHNAAEVIAAAHKAGLHHTARAGDEAAGDAKPKAAPAKRTPPPRRAATEGKMTLLDAAAKVLAEEGRPMTNRELAEAMIAKGYWSTKGTTPWATVGAAIYVSIQTQGDGSPFRKVDKGTFGLAK